MAIKHTESREKVRALIAKTGLDQVGFAEYFGIPKGTVLDWAQGRSKCNDYLLALMDYKITREFK